MARAFDRSRLGDDRSRPIQRQARESRKDADGPSVKLESPAARTDLPGGSPDADATIPEEASVAGVVRRMQHERGNAFVQQMIARRLGATDAVPVARDTREAPGPDPGDGFRSPESAAPNGLLPHADEAIVRASDSTAQPLPATVRHKFEQSLGTDLDGVRVHTGADSARASQAISARAFTIGQDIHFGEGEYNPESAEGEHLLAHEVAHTVQQSSGGSSAQAKLEVSEPGDALELEADRVAVAMVRGEAARVSPATEVQRVARKKEDASPFKGWAREADARALEASDEAGGFAPIKVTTDYAISQVQVKDQQLEEFRRADIPEQTDNTTLPQYKRLIDLRQEYISDATRIGIAQDAFNGFVGPGSLANKSVAQLKRLQFELGYVDDTSPEDDLSKRQKLVLSKKLDEGEMKKLNEDVEIKEDLVNGKRTEILASVFQIHAALERRAAILAKEELGKAQEELTSINEKIKAITEAAEAVEKVTEAVSLAGFGVPEFIGVGGGAGAAAEGGEALKTGADVVGEKLKSGLEVGGKGTTLVGGLVASIMTERYRDDIQTATTHIAEAEAKVSAAQDLDAELSLKGASLDQQGKMMELAGLMGELARALEDRKAYFAKLGAETDRATGKRAGGEVSQYLAYVSQASETKSYLGTAQDSASSARDVMDEQISQMDKHRNQQWGDWRTVYGDGGYGSSGYHRDGDGPDLELLRAALEGLDSFIKSARDELEQIYAVIGSLPAAT